MSEKTMPAYPSVDERARAATLLCGSLRIHGEHLWTGQSSGESLRCPGHLPSGDSRPVQTLRAAAAQLRDLRDGLPDRFRGLADPLADWLEHAAKGRWAAEYAASTVNGIGADDIDRDTPLALKVARAILGEDGDHG